jgi:predicted MFS family arabinose efflux permease
MHEERRPLVFAVNQNVAAARPQHTQERLLTAQFGVLCLSALFSALGFSSVIPTVARFVATDLNGGDLEVGVALGVFSFSAVLARPWIGRLGDRRGRRVLIAGGSLITSIVLAAHALADSYLALLVARLVMGAVQGAFFVGTVTLTTDLAPEHRRGEAASYFSVAIYGGMAFGPWLGEWAAGRWGFDGGFLLGGLCMGIAAVIAFWLPDFVGDQKPNIASEENTRRRALLYRTAIWPGVVMALGIMIFPALHGFMPKLMDERALGDAGPIYALYGLLVLVLRLVCSRLPDALGTGKTAAVALMGSSVGMLIMGSFVSRPGMFVGAAVLAIGGSLLYPALMIAAVDGVPANERAQAMSTFTMFFELSGGIGAPVLGVVAWLSGTTVAAFYGASVLAAIGLPVLFTWRRRNPSIT